jgi:hypothetical protein
VAYADELLDEARYLAERGKTLNRQVSLRRAASTAYYALFHMLIDDFIQQWGIVHQRANLGRLFNHGNMKHVSDVLNKRLKGQAGKTEAALQDIAALFVDLQDARQFADYDVANAFPVDVQALIRRTGGAFVAWQSIRHERVAQDYLFDMFEDGRGRKSKQMVPAP